ncbi:MAG: NifU family protein [Patescibacteria group bacterium]
MPENTQDFKTRVEQALEAIAPPLAAHGGGVSLVRADPETGIVTVRLTGACAGCPYAEDTLHMVVEDALQSAVPEVTLVQSVDESTADRV